MLMPTSLSVIFYSLSVVALVANIFLIMSCCRIKKKNTDIMISIILASIDLFVPLSSAVVKLITIIQQSNYSMPSYSFCVVVGAMRLLCVVTSVFLVSAISYHRYVFMAEKGAPRILYFFICLVYGFSFGWNIFIAADGRFEVTPGSLNCAPVAQSSTLAAATFCILGVEVLLFFVTSVYCNFQVLQIVSQNLQIMPDFKPRTPLNPVRIRIGVATLVYSVIVIPASIVLIGEGFSLSKHYAVANIVLYFSLGLVPLANPCLILFTHALIHRQFKQLLGQYLNFFKRKK